MQTIARIKCNRLQIARKDGKAFTKSEDAFEETALWLLYHDDETGRKLESYYEDGEQKQRRFLVNKKEEDSKPQDKAPSAEAAAIDATSLALLSSAPHPYEQAQDLAKTGYAPGTMGDPSSGSVVGVNDPSFWEYSLWNETVGPTWKKFYDYWLTVKIPLIVVRYEYVLLSLYFVLHPGDPYLHSFEHLKFNLDAPDSDLF